MDELDKILDKNEKVFWEGKPKFWAFLLSSSVPAMIFGLFFMIFLIPFIIIATIKGGLWGWGIFLLPHFWVGIIFIFGIPTYQILVYKHIYYAITNKRVLYQKGLIGRDFVMVDFDQITNAEVNLGLFDKLLGGNTGSILISTAGTFTGRRGMSRPYTLRNIENPYDVFKFFKKVSHAVKTDIQFPNLYRPKKNIGYETSYNPKK